MNLEIVGLGTALPRNRVPQELAAEFAGHRIGTAEDTASRGAVVQALYRRSGVRYRHTVLLDESESNDPADQSFYLPSETKQDRGPTTSERMAFYESSAKELAVRATARALEDADIPAEAIGHLVTASCSGFSAPGFDLSVIERLGLNSDTTRTHVGFMGCHGALNALRVARGYAAVDPDSHVLVCATELCTLHHQYGWDPEKIVANSLFADGSAALVLKAGEAESRTPWRIVDSRSWVVSGTDDSMTWKIGDHGFEMTLSAQVPDLIRAHLKEKLTGWLGDHGLTIDQVGSWAVHPGGPRILRACAQAAEFDPELLGTSQAVLAEMGNMSSPTVLFILDRLRSAAAPLPCVMLGFGPGLTIEYALVM